jgi:hypothetical protein
MKASELIIKLQEAINEYGDQLVEGDWFEKDLEIVLYDLADYGKFFYLTEYKEETE